MVLAEECFYFTVDLLNSGAFSTSNGGVCTFGYKISNFWPYCGTF